MADKDKKIGFISVIARFIKYNFRLTLVILIFALLSYLAVFGNKGLLQRFQLESEKRDLQNQLEAELKRTDELKKDIDDLQNSDEKIEKVAREKYGMTKEGEKIYKIIYDTLKKEER